MFKARHSTSFSDDSFSCACAGIAIQQINAAGMITFWTILVCVEGAMGEESIDPRARFKKQIDSHLHGFVNEFGYGKHV